MRAIQRGLISRLAALLRLSLPRRLDRRIVAVGLGAFTLLALLVALDFATSLRLPIYHPQPGKVSCDGSAGFQSAGARTFLLNPETLSATRQGGSAEYQALIAQANTALLRPPPSVTDKSTLPPSGDRRDYISLSTYSWPDPRSPGGAVWKDGQYNPATYTDAYDYSRLLRLVNDGEVLGLAYYYTHDLRYAAKLAENARRWFVSPETRMNPNLRYAQISAGGELGDGNGVVDGWHLIYLVDAIGLIGQSHELSASDMTAIRQWFSDYLEWLQTTPQGRHEFNAKNNHSDYYDLERISFALFSGRENVAHDVSLYAGRHRLRQIMFWGSMPREESRAKPTHYMPVGALGFTHLATIAECSGVDLWRARDLGGGAIGPMIHRLSTFASGRRAWPTGHLPTNGEPLVGAFAEAAAAFNDPSLLALARSVANQDYATDEDYRWGGLKAGLAR